MENSWESVEKHNRRERLRKRFRGFGVIVVLVYLLSVFGIPPLFNSKDDTQPPDTNSDVQATTPAVDGDKNIVRQTESTHHPAAVGTDVVTEPKPDITSSDVSDLTSASTPEIESARVSDSPPMEKAPDPELLRAAEQVMARLRRRIEQLDGSSGRLEKYGGPKWKSIQILAESATTSNDPVVAAEEATQAIAQLDALATDLDFAEFQEQVRDKKPRDMLAALAKFRVSHSDHPRLSELEQSLSPLSREQWLEMSSEELKQASPDDAGFSEGWLPIASAWQLVGNDAEAREAVRQAVDALQRMTLPERVIESTIEICQHESFDPVSAKQLIENAAEMCEQVSDLRNRGTYYAHLSGLSHKLSEQRLASDLLTRSLALIEKDGLGSVWQKQTFTQQARAASWTQSPESIFEICEKIEKLPYPKPLVNANAYGHAAIAAARHNDRTQFLKAMLLTENALAPRRVYDFPDYTYAVRLAEANMLERRWRAAVIIANNIPDPYISASLLFRIMKDAPQEIRARNLPDLFESFAEQRWASPACAGHAEHRIRSGESLLSVAEWTQSLPLASQRAAAFAGISRSVGTTSATVASGSEESIVGPIDVKEVVALMEAAERVANQIQEPLDSAFVWMHIARTWNLLGKTGRYQQAITHLDDRLFDAWTDVWESRPPVKRSYNGGYIDTDKRHRDEEDHIVGLIVACHRHLAEMQTDLGDSRGAKESLLNLANAAGFRCATATFNDQNYLHIKALLNRLDGTTGIGPDSIPLLEHRSDLYTRALMAAWAKDIPGLEAALPDLVENSHRKLASANEKAQPARAYGELAILFAERGNVESYREARRSAQSLITQKRAGSEMKLILATADALAGEFALAESNLVRGTLGWYGDANRPRKQLAIALAADGQWEKALEHARRVSVAQPLYRAQALSAVAEARGKDSSQTPQDVLDWVNSLESQVDKSAAYCGLSLAAAVSR